MNTEKKYITQSDLAKKTGKKRQWVNYLVKEKKKFNTETIAGKIFIIWDYVVDNFIKENTN